MKQYEIIKSHLTILIGVLILIQSAAYVSGINCPHKMTKKCSCEVRPTCESSDECDKSVPQFVSKCTKNGEQITIEAKEEHVENYLGIKCTNGSDRQLYKLLNFKQNNPDFRVDHLKVDSCPASVITIIETSLSEHINQESFKITTVGSTTLPKNIFKGATEMTSLHLERNRGETQITDTFSCIRQLGLDWSNVMSLPVGIIDCHAKVAASIQGEGNGQTFRANLFRDLIDLQTLRINRFDLGTLPTYIFEFQTELERLDLSRNNLSTLPVNLFKSQIELKTLNLGGNSLVKLPENIFAFQTKLKSLRLHRNQLQKLPDNIFKSLSKVKRLYLQENKLTILPAKLFESQNRLQWLHLEANNLIKLPENIFENQRRLKYLISNGNNLTILPEKIFNSLSDLKVLDLSENKLTKIPKNVFEGLANIQSNGVKLSGNPWQCDDYFMRTVGKHANRFDFDTIQCANGEPVRKKVKRLDDRPKQTNIFRTWTEFFAIDKYF